MCSVAEQECEAVWLASQVGDLLTPLVTDPDISIEVASFAAVALGLVFVATCHASSVEAILQVPFTFCLSPALLCTSPTKPRTMDRLAMLLTSDSG